MMLRESQIAVIARNEIWTGIVATEPYEAGWASEALVFVRALAFEGTDGWTSAGPPAAMPAVQAKVQISADGMRWIDEGSVFNLPRSTGLDTFVRVGHFGNWLRITAELPAGLAMKALVTLHVK